MQNILNNSIASIATDMMSGLDSAGIFCKPDLKNIDYSKKNLRSGIKAGKYSKNSRIRKKQYKRFLENAPTPASALVGLLATWLVVKAVKNNLRF